MPTLDNGVEFRIHAFGAGGQELYSEMHARDGGTVTAVLSCAWEDAVDFRDGMVGYTEVDDGFSVPLLVRTPAYQIPTYDTNMRCVSLRLMKYGSHPTVEDWRLYPGDGNYGEDLEAAAVPVRADPDLDDDLEGWFRAGFAMWEAAFQRLPYEVLTDDEVNHLSDRSGVFRDGTGSEMLRYCVRRDQMTARELKRPDYGFVVEGTDPPQTVGVVGFTPEIERVLTIQWVQVPWASVPRGAIERAILTVNNSVWDATDGRPGYPPETVLFRNVAGIDTFYYGADGRKYCDPTYQFGVRAVRGQIGDQQSLTFGWNHFQGADRVFRRLIAKKAAGAVFEPPPNTPPYRRGNDVDWEGLFLPQH